MNNSRLNVGRLIRASDRLTLVALLALGVCVGSVLLARINLEDLFSNREFVSDFRTARLLVSEGYTRFIFPLWDPGVNAGEPRLLDEPILPLFLASILTLFVPADFAFLLAVLAPLALAPIACWRGLSASNLREPGPFAAALILSAVVIVWVTNTEVTALLTVLADYGLLYSLLFLVLGYGSFSEETRRSRPPFGTMVWLALAVLSYTGMLYSIPLFLVLIVCLQTDASMLIRLARALLVIGFIVAVSLWHVVPQLHDRFWRYAVPLTELQPLALPLLSWAFPTIAVLLLLTFRLGTLRAQSKQLLLHTAFWMLVGVVFILLFQFHSSLWLRSFPIAEVLSSIAVVSFSCCLPLLLRSAKLRLFLRVGLPGLVLPLMLLVIGRPATQVPVQAPFPEIERQLAARTIWESFSSDSVVPERWLDAPKETVLDSRRFGRGVLEPYVRYVQSELSAEMQCPKEGLPCARLDVAASEYELDLFGISEVVLRSDLARTSATKAPFLFPTGSDGAWTRFSVRPKPELVLISAKEPSVVEGAWFNTFFEWFLRFNGNEPFLVASEELPEKVRASIAREKDSPWRSEYNCRASVLFNVSRLELTTNCPGKAHFLKFAYHPSWKSNTGDPVFLVSPGFIGIIPSESHVQLFFGRHFLWLAARAVSIVAFLTLALAWLAVVVFKLRARRFAVEHPKRVLRRKAFSS